MWHGCDLLPSQSPGVEPALVGREYVVSFKVILDLVGNKSFKHFRHGAEERNVTVF